MELLTLKGGITRQAADPAPAGPRYVLDTNVVPAAPLAPRRGRRRVPEVISHDRAVMRDLVLGALLAPQFVRDEEPREVGAYTTDNTRDSFPKRLLEERSEVPTEGGEAGRLPREYVVSLARGTTRVIASETRKKKTSSIPLGPLAFQDAHVVRALSKLDSGHQHWLRYAYGDSKDWADESGSVVALWALFEPKLGKAQGKTLQKAKGLAHLAVQDMKLFMNCHRSNYGAGRLQQLLGVTDVNWRKHWTGRWEALRSLVLAMDQAALEALHLELADYPFVLLDRGL